MKTWVSIGAIAVLLLIGILLLSGALPWSAASRAEQTSDRLENTPVAGIGKSDGSENNSVRPSVPPKTTQQNPSTSRSAPVLPWEARILRDGALYAPAVQQLLLSKQFDRSMRLAEEEMARDPDAQDVRDAYKKTLEEMLRNGDSAKLSGLACGLSLCVASIRALDAGGTDQYAALNKALLNSDRARMYSIIDAEVALDGRLSEYRMIFSTDPSAGAVSVPSLR